LRENGVEIVRRLLVTVQFAEREPAEKPAPNLDRLEPEGLVRVCDCLLEIAERDGRVPAVQVSLGVIRVTHDRLVELSSRRFELPQIGVGHPAAQVRFSTRLQ
jgi:hypothetical protein